jgi:hypothetical protein
VKVVPDMLMMRLMAVHMPTMLVMMNVGSHMLRVVLRLVMLRMLDVTAMLHVMFVFHFNLLQKLINRFCT